MPQAPSDYDVFGTPDQVAAAKFRWRGVLDGIVKMGDLTRPETDAMFNSDLISKMIAARKAQPAQHNPLTAHFIDYVVKYITQRYGAKALYEGGLRITTTLDLPTQAVADKWVKSGVGTYAKRGVNTGAMLVMNPADGEILAMVGSADYNNAAIRGQINLTGVDPLGWRGVGSSFKVYTYAAALQAGLVTPATLLNDEAGQARRVDHAADRAGAIAQSAGAVDIRIGGWSAGGQLHAQPRGHGGHREPGRCGDDAGPRSSVHGGAPRGLLGV